MKYLKEKLFRIHLFSAGVFVPQQLYFRPENRKKFYMLKQRRPYSFSIVEEEWSKNNNHRTSIHFLKTNVAARNPHLPSENVLPPLKNILSQVLWTEVILHWGLTQQLSYEAIQANNEMIQIDTFNNDFVPRAETTLILSTNFRIPYLEGLTSKKIFVPESLSGKWTDQVLSQFYNDFVIGRSEVKINFHEDKREYPGFHEKLTGKEKWDLDQFYLRTKNPLPPQYKMGVQ